MVQVWFERSARRRNRRSDRDSLVQGRKVPGRQGSVLLRRSGDFRGDADRDNSGRRRCWRHGRGFDIGSTIDNGRRASYLPPRAPLVLAAVPIATRRRGATVGCLSGKKPEDQNREPHPGDTLDQMGGRGHDLTQLACGFRSFSICLTTCRAGIPVTPPPPWVAEDA